jgi:excisionase family DNA binding protein
MLPSIPVVENTDLTLTQVAAALGVSERTVNRHVDAGRLVARRVDRKRIVVTRAALAAFLARGVPINPSLALTSPMA